MATQQEAYGEGDSVAAAVLDAHQQLPRSTDKADEQVKSEVVSFGAETNGLSGVIKAWAKVRRVEGSS